MKFTEDTFITFLTQIITTVLGLITVVVVARILGPEGKGAYSLALLVPTLLAMAGNLGIGIANVYFGGKGKYRWTELVSNSLASSLILGFPFVMGFLVYFFVFHPSFLKEVEPRCISIAAFILPFSLLTTYFSSILLGQKRIRKYNLVSLIQYSALLIFTAFILSVMAQSVFGAILAWMGACFIAAIFSFILVRRTTEIKWSFHFSIFKDSVRFGIKGHLGNLIQFLNYRLDMFLVAFFMSLPFVGYYSISVAIAEVLWFFPAAVGTAIFARTPGLSPQEITRSTPRICRNTFFVAILAAAILFVFGKFIILLFFGPNFSAALKPLWILLPGITALSLPKVLANELAGRGKPYIGTIAAVISLAVNIPLNIILIPEIGIEGAALASSISYSVAALVVVIAFVKISKVNWVDIIVLKREDLRFYSKAFSNSLSYVAKDKMSSFHC